MVYDRLSTIDPPDVDTRANTPTNFNPRQLRQNKAREKAREANLPKAKAKGRAKGNQVAHQEVKAQEFALTS